MTGLRWLRAALSAKVQVEPLVKLRTEVGLAQLAFIAGDYLASFAAIESALPVARLLGDDVVLARCLATAGYVWWLLDPERSAALFEEGLEAAHRCGDDWTRSTGLAGLGWARYFAGYFGAASGPLQDAIELTAYSGRRQQFAMAVLGRAAVELWRGQLAAAEASAQQALGVLRAIGDATWTSAALAIVAEIERARGRLEAAGQHAGEGIEVAGRANSAINVMIATGHLGRILLARGEPGAASHLDQAVQLARAFGVRPLLAWWLDSLGELAELESRYDDAQSWYEQAVAHAGEYGLAADAARTRHHMGRLAWIRGDQASAVNSCHEALAGQLEADDRLGLVETLETLGGLLIDEGRARRGLPLLAAAATARDGLGFPWRPMETSRITGWVAAGREDLGEQSQPAWNVAPASASNRPLRWPAGDGVFAGGLRSDGRASPPLSVTSPILSPAASPILRSPPGSGYARARSKITSQALCANSACAPGPNWPPRFPASPGSDPPSGRCSSRPAARCCYACRTQSSTESASTTQRPATARRSCSSAAPASQPTCGSPR